MMDMNNRGLSFKVSRLVGMLVDKTVTKTSELRENAVNNIGFLKYLYRERVAFYEMYQLQKVETDQIKRVVSFLSRPDKDVKRLDGLKKRADARKKRSESPETVKEVAEILDATSAAASDAARNTRDFMYAGDYKREFIGFIEEMKTAEAKALDK